MGNDNFDPSNLDNRAMIGTVDWDSGSPQGLRKAIRIDPYTHALLTSDYEHHEIHAGEHHIGMKSALLDTADTIDLMFKSNAKPKLNNMLLSVEGALAYTLNFWGRGASSKLFVPANTVQFSNRNHHLLAASEALYTSGISLCHTAAGTEANPTTFGPIYVGSATTGGRADVGGESGSRAEILLQDGVFYGVEVTSRADANAVTIYLDWYDHEAQTPYLYNPVGW